MAKEIKNENAEAVVEAISKTEQFFKKYGKTLGIAAAAVVVVTLGLFLWNMLVYVPAANEAKGQMAYAEEYFRAGDYEVAMNGNGNELGFAEIIDQYGAKAGASAYFYAGVCELHLGNWESAINYLKNYNGKDAILKARATACIGDAYVALENYEQALVYFVKAAGVIDNLYAADYLLKAGAVAEKLGQNEKALGFYETIKNKYPQSVAGYDIDKYIGRLQ